MLDKPDYITGAGANAYNSVALGALLEVLLIIANVGTAVVLFPILKRQSEAGALGYVAARLVECTFIAIGLVSLLAILTVREDGAVGATAALGRHSSRSMIGRSCSVRASSSASATGCYWAT